MHLSITFIFTLQDTVKREVACKVQLMTMEDKEIKFWMEHPEWEIPFLEECNMDWEQIKNNYIVRKEKEKQALNEQFEKLMEDVRKGKYSKDGKRVH